jgi:capsular polysaccharide biosynthesis protein
MSQRGLGLRRSIRLVRRHKFLFGIMVLLGLAAGGAYAKFNPPLLTRTALVLLSENGQAAQNGAIAASQNEPNPYIGTQELIAKSSPVLLGALPHVRPVVSINELSGAIGIGSPTPYIISVSAKEKTASDAAATANAVAQSYISYAASASSAYGQVRAQLLQLADSNTETGRLSQLVNYGLYGVAGGLFGALIGTSLAVARNRRDRRLRERDAIANSIGVPVLASFAVGHPSNAGEWTRLLEDYKPGALYALQLRNAIRQLEMAVAEASSGRGDGRWSITVLSLTSDRRALALGPQFAVYAASQGIPTALVIGPQQDAAVTAALRTACAATPASPKQQAHLRLIVSDEDLEVQRDVALAVVVAVVDGRNPQVPATMRTTATLLGVSAGAATADQLARVAISAVSTDREISGILVADPDPEDATTGRLPQLRRRTVRRMSARVTGIMTEIRR